MKRYFIAECDEEGEAISESIFEIDPPPTWRAVLEALLLGVVIGVVITIIIT